MKEPFKSVARFFLRVVLLYALMLTAWPAVRGAYSTTFRAACQVLSGQVGANGRVAVAAAEPQDDPLLDVVFDVSTTESSTVKRRRLSSFLSGYLPLAFLTALVIGTPVPWKRRLCALAAALAGLHAFIGFKIAYSVFSLFATDGAVRIVDVGPLARTLLLYLNTLLNESAITLFTIPVVIWLLSTVRREDLAVLGERLPQEQALRFRPTVVAGLVCVLGVLGILAVFHADRWQQTVWWSAIGTERLTSEEHLARAGVLLTEGRVEDSIHEARTSLRLDPRSASAHVALAAALARQGKYDDAIEHYRAAIRLDPSDPAAHHGLGLVFASQGNLDRAAPALEEAVRLDPDLGEAHHRLGTILGKMGDFEHGIEHLTRAVDLLPGDPRPSYDLAVTLSQMGRLDVATEQLERALRLEPEWPWPHLAMGRLLERQGHVERALGSYRTTIRLAAGQPDEAVLLDQASARIRRLLDR